MHPAHGHHHHRQGWRAALPALVLWLAFGAPAQVVTPPAIHGEIAEYSGANSCLSCHGINGEYETGVELQFMKTTHWTWVHTNTVGSMTQVVGKHDMINNYCIALQSNEPRCTSCHAGVGWRDKTFDFNDASKIDCLVCHDTTGTYKKTPTGAGAPDPTVNLLSVAQKAGRSSRATCGACHFYGGGADAVKHGDLDSSMTNPKRTTDVHMGTDGMNKSCTFCHQDTSPGATAHDIVGSRYTKPAADNWLCEKCHTPNQRHANPDTRARLEAHVSTVACQSCHIPAFARGGKQTKLTWDWSTAGKKNPDGTEIIIKDAKGDPLYDTKKGNFTWGENVAPEYRWFNGEVLYTTLEDVINPAEVVTFNKLRGGLNDPKARIVPVKRFTGRQPYDPVNNGLVVPHLFATNATDTAAYWKGYNWTNAVAAGMNYVGKEFSGKIGWVETEMFWIQNHMVAPKEQALKCAGCHTPESKLNFAQLGYPAERAARLQTMAGFTVQMVSDASGLELQWMGTPGNSYQVQQTSDPRHPASWSNAPDGLHLRRHGHFHEVNRGRPAESGATFYRVVRSEP